MTLHILSNINMDLIAPTLQSRFGKIERKGYNQIIQPLTAMSENDSIKDDVIWIHLDGPEWSAPDPLEFLRFFQDILDAIEAFCQKNIATTVIVSNLALATYSIHTQQQKFLVEFSRQFSIVRERLVLMTETYPGLYILEFEKLVQEYGRQFLNDAKYWYLGRIRYSMFGIEKISQELQRLHKAIQGDTQKVLILDLDNTLWGGVLGEEGPQGIKLSEEGVGKAHRDFQKLIRAAKENGVMLTLCSKNNMDDVKDVFDQNNMMVLAWHDFVDHRINWHPKAKNLEEMATALNLSLDSFVFIDDNPVERDSIRKLLPDVTVPEMPDDPADIPAWFVKEVINEYFNRISLTTEDNDKVGQYSRQNQRETERKTMSLDEYLHSLSIRYTIHRNPEKQIQRIAQLTQKTNQFNLTTRRYTETEIREFIQSDSADVFTLEYEDKFGKEGIVGVMITIIKNDMATIDTFLLSCRIIGRQMEHRFLQDVATALKDRGIETIIGEYMETPKNILVKNLYPDLGFSPSDDQYTAPPAYLITHINHVLNMGETTHDQ